MSRPAHRHLSGVRCTAAAGLAAVIALSAPVAADAKTRTYLGTATDPAGDAASPAVDLLEVKVRYKTTGSILFIATTAGPIDGANADATFVVSVSDKACEKPLLGGGGLFSMPDPATVFTQTVKGKKIITGKEREATGEITNNVYTVKAKYKAFAGETPGCFAGALLDQKNDLAVIDEFEAVKLKRS